MKGYVISDSHSFHRNIIIPKDIDFIIHAGDATNYQESYKNEQEMRDFITWYSSLNIKYKIYSPGNHDISIERGFLTKDNFEQAGIILAIHKSIEIDNIKIFCSPYTPTFGIGWAYNKDRGKLFKFWDMIPNDTNILVTHGPPKGILDLSTNRDSIIEYCGDKSLLNRVKIVQPKYHIFGHIHDDGYHLNYGTRTIDNCYTTFINATLVEDGKFDKGLIHQGIEIEI